MNNDLGLTKAARGIIIIVIVVLLGVAAAIAGRGVSSRSAPPPLGPVTVCFAGYTNDASGACFGRFAVTNGTGVHIRRWAPCRIELQRKPNNFRVATIIGGAVSLAPQQSEIVLVPVGTNQGPWKIVILVSRDGYRRWWFELTLRYPYLPAHLQPNIQVEGYAPDRWVEQ